MRQLQHSRNSYLMIRCTDIAEDLHSSASVIASYKKAKAQAQWFLAMAAYAKPSENRSQHTSAKSCMLLVLLIACLSASHSALHFSVLLPALQLAVAAFLVGCQEVVSSV